MSSNASTKASSRRTDPAYIAERGLSLTFGRTGTAWTRQGRLWFRLWSTAGPVGACGVEVVFGAASLGVERFGENAGPVFE
jgi:hypothetical protein